MCEYFDELLRKYPNLGNILQPLFSGHFLTKEKGRATDSRWMACVGLYRAFVADVILRSKNSKAVGRTNMLLGLIIYQSKCPDSVWKLLQRVKIIPTRGTVEEYLKSLPKADFATMESVITHYDNCDIYRHIAKRYTTHSSEYLHMVTHLVFTIPWSLNIPTGKMWKTYNAGVTLRFAQKLLLDFGTQCDIAKNASDIVRKAKGYGGLKFTLQDSCIDKPKSTLTVLPV